MFDPNNPPVDAIFPWTFVRECEAKCKLCNIFSGAFTKISIYLLKIGGWDILDKNN
jgi:hypothetical protein